MATAYKVPWFVAQRSEAIAGLLLTARDDVRVRQEKKHDDGVDLLVELGTGETLSTRLLVVQVRGATSSNPTDWMRNVKPLFPARNIHLPACVLAINLRDNRAQYAWLADPLIEARQTEHA